MPTSNLWFSAEAYDPWLRRYAAGLGPKAAAKLLGVRWPILKQITDRGWVRPFVSLPGLVDRYDPAELQELVDQLLGESQPVMKVEAGKALVLSACMKCACDALGISDLIRAKRLSFVGRLEGRHGIGSIIGPREFLDALEGPKLEGYRHEDLKQLLGVDSPTASWIVRSGVVRTMMLPHPRSRELVSILPNADLEAFLHEYVALGMIARAQGTLPKPAAARLARRGIFPLAMPAQCSQIYRRADIESR